MDTQLLTVEELSRVLRIPKPTIYYLSQKGEIPAIKIGKHWRYNRQTIEKWLKDKENPKGARRGR